MIAILLAAGYGTRMKSISGNKPKALLDVGGKTVLDHLMIQLKAEKKIERFVLVTNTLFHDQFKTWRDEMGHDDLTVLDDGTTSNEDRLGAIGDMHFAIREANLDGDLLVAGTDNIFNFSIDPFLAAFEKNKTDQIVVIEEKEIERVKRGSSVHLDATNRVTLFEEKPENPTSLLVCPPLYIFRRETITLIKKFLDEGNNPDSPGRFLAWLYKETPVHAWQAKGGRKDIGNPDSYHEAQKAMSE